MKLKLRTVVIDCKDAQVTSAFYSKLMGWEVTAREPDWVLLRDPKGGTGFSFQTEEDYVRPVWPEEPGKPTKMLHLDFLVDNLSEAVAHALACGAVKSPRQFLEDRGVVVFFDPDGHPFCLFEDPGYAWEE